MNQEQNNFNVNNFNTEGNNGMPNNQSLNNQNFNQGMGVNQQPINLQTQPLPGYEQPIIQEPTPQPMDNIFESSNSSNQKLNITSKNKINLGIIIGFVIIVSIVIIGIIFGTRFLNKNDVNPKPNNNESNITDNNGNITEDINVDNNSLNHKKNNRLFSINDIITSKNNYFEYNNYKWEFLFSGIDGVSIWKGTIKNISNKVLKGNLRVKFYDSNNKVIGDIQRYDLEDAVDSSSVFVLEPGEESNISFTYYSEELNEGYSLQDVKYISIEDIE